MSFVEARKRANISQEAVAKQIGVDQSAVSLWESGKTRPRAAVLLKLADLYECTVDELLNRPTNNAKAKER